ncbi:LemA family protein [Methylobacterium gregans]|uniref:Protein LemA n=1 Tax=Methylobacterium gregans TaxID=374424 RepID=A0AA37HQQ2_9HYPH|nr:LemA family protein [Methylobacterium gregans]MDQ0520573.1 LemA protein [Methylobacterium gregans]GJD80080.1 Protein LemA [Methylobacterium gregans]GLS52168.1 membrane protein [Methylobacterium gregans]
MKWVLAIAVIAVLAWLVFTYNGLVALRQRTAQAFGDIDVQLRQRHDLIPNLVEAVRGYAAHERQTLEAVVAARNAAMAARDPGETIRREDALQASLGRLIGLSEAYPDLKASTTFQALQGELAALEDKLAAARRFFNNAVAEYNAATAAVPAVFFAAALGLRPQPFFDLGAETRTALETPPTVRF